MSWTPPLRSRPRRVGLLAMTSTEAAISANTTSSTNPLRRELVIGSGLRGEDEQQATVLVVGREYVRLRGLGAVALGVHGHGLVEYPHAPLERRADVVVAVLKGEAEHVPHRLTERVGLAEPGELAHAAAEPDHSRVLIADHERSVGRRVVVVEQLEQEAEAALGAALGASCETCGALPRERAIPAVGTDEMRHGFLSESRRSRRASQTVQLSQTGSTTQSAE